jgi:hypothetical protein
VPSYETGTTEFGSSGAAIFDVNNKLRGTLSAGDAACSVEIFDYYQKLSHSWNDYSDSTEQLKYWLDPSNTGIQKCDNYYPVDNLIEHGEILSNIDSTENKIDGTLTSGWGYLSGHNSKNSSEFAEHYYRNGTKYIYALNVDINKAYAAQVNSKIIFKIWTGDEFPETLIFSKELLLFELVPGEENFIRLDTAIYVDHHFFVGYEIFYSTPLDTFSVLIAGPREDEGINSAFVRLNDRWQPLTDGTIVLNTSLAVFPLVFDIAPPEDSQEWKLPTEFITLYPNPAKDFLHLFFKEKQESDVFITAYDIYGRPVLSRIYHSPEPNFPVEINVLDRGLYILNIEYAGGLIKKKFIKL